MPKDNLDDIWDVVGTSDAAKAIESDNTEPVRTAKKANYVPQGIARTIDGKSVIPTIYITKSGAFIKFEYLGPPDSVATIKLIKKVTNYFTLTTKLITGQFKSIKSCIADKKNRRIIVPRFGVFEILSKSFGLAAYRTKSQISPGENPGRQYKWSGKLNSNQEIIYEYIMANIYTPERVAAGSAGLVLNLEAGQGKSFLAAYMIYILQKKTAVILHSTSLVEQWAKVLKSVFGEKVSIGYYYAKKKVLGDIMLIIIDSACSSEFKIAGKIYTPKDFYNMFGFVVYDECHTYANKFSLRALKVAHAPYMLGLSATPDENLMGFDTLVWWELGPVINAKDLPGYEGTSEDFKATVHRIMYYGPPEYTKQLKNEYTDMTSTTETITMITEDRIRSSVVIDCVRKGLDQGLFMFVFADRRGYLNDLQDLLKNTLDIDGEIVESDKDFIRIVGGAKNEELELAEASSKVIFTTYQYMGTGKSIVKMNGLVLATPRKSKMKQYINRIFRLGSDATVERHIWDICDMKLKLSTQWTTRQAYYKSKGYTIEQEKIKFDEWTGVQVCEVEDGEDVASEMDSEAASEVASESASRKKSKPTTKKSEDIADETTSRKKSKSVKSSNTSKPTTKPADKKLDKKLDGYVSNLLKRLKG